MAGAGVAVAIPAYDGNATWGAGTDADMLLAALYAYASAVGRPYVRSPGKTGLDLLLETTRRGGKRDAVEDWLAVVAPRPVLQLSRHSDRAVDRGGVAVVDRLLGDEAAPVDRR